ncbi:MAG: methyltransferase domain-containing protein [Candidatus Vogelbacteria bacterium]|nr:methyltransferase domain-containing protein [Candidatus Vogelbacteria bacterium]
MNDYLTNPDKRFAPVAHSKTFNRILDTLALRTKKVLDLGSGYGEYLIHFGPDSLGVTSTVAEVDYARAKSINIIKGNVELIDQLILDKPFEAIWANNLFEHLLAPHTFLMKLKTVAAADTVLVLGVPVIPRLAWLMRLSKFRGALAAAHVNFFTRESLKLTVERAGWLVKQIRPFIFTNYFLDYLASFLAPHLYVVAYNNADFKYPTKKLKEWQNEPHYHQLLNISQSTPSHLTLQVET